MDAEKQFSIPELNQNVSTLLCNKICRSRRKVYHREFPGRKIQHRNKIKSLRQRFTGRVTTNNNRGARLTARTRMLGLAWNRHQKSPPVGCHMKWCFMMKSVYSDHVLFPFKVHILKAQNQQEPTL